jgi:sulfur-carrier protein adenylyltransferase/sulfurtransferase
LKVDSARERIGELNPAVKVETYNLRLTSENALDLFRDYDIIIDGTDNFPTRYLTNDACVLLNKPNVYGSIFRFDGQATIFWAEHGPCYRCLYPEPPPPGMVPSCAEGGVIGILPGIIGCLQANEAVKLILGVGDPLVGRLVTFSALEMKFREFRLRKDPDCPICGEIPTIRELIDYEIFCGVQPHSEETETSNVAEIAPRELAELLKSGNGNAPFVLDVRNPEEWEICHLEGAKLIPLPELPDRLNELDRNRDIVVHCKTGRRSEQAIQLMQKAGFDRLKNLTGGILAWADDVDPSLVKY